jgi:hypothetical protein
MGKWVKMRGSALAGLFVGAFFGQFLDGVGDGGD